MRENARRGTALYRLLLWLYGHAPGAAFVCERSYRLVAAHRNFFDRITWLVCGPRFVPPSYLLTRWLFLRSLGVVYLIAFVSLWVQLPGLMGQHGILPAANLLRGVSRNFGVEAYRFYPTLAWLNSSDGFLGFLAGSGTFVSLLAVLGIATAPSLILAWMCYLSLIAVGGDFMSFQWDILLLEAGFLAIFFAPWRVLAPHWEHPGRQPRQRDPEAAEEAGQSAARSEASPSLKRGGQLREPTPSLVLLWLLRWLLFRLLFMSGAVKLLSDDPTWRKLTALDYHYYTQPLPTPVAWYMAQLPHWFHRVSTLLMFSIELGVPFLIFAPRRLRLAGAALLAFLQVMLGITGNYTFFNLLTLVLCLTLLDDALLRRVLPGWLAARIAPEPEGSSTPVRVFANPARATPAAPAATGLGRAVRTPGQVASRVVRASVGLVVFVTSGAHEVARLSRGAIAFQPTQKLVSYIEPFHIVNGYGLFAVMTTARLEIVVQGSNDGEAWLDYEFKYKPGDPKRPPPWVEPHQPRLDWQMWFAALGSYQDSPWFVNFMVRLLEGSPEVLALLGKNPFPHAPPHFVRAVVYDYHFTNFTTRRDTGDWWRRELKGGYFPVASLKATSARQ